MRKLVLIGLVLLTFQAMSQEFESPAEGKTLVYFIRSAGTGALINFKYFDGDKYLGKINGMNYFLYECDPGEHVFWAAAENRDFIKGDLQPNKTYVIEVRPTMGAFKAAVRLHQVDQENDKFLKKAAKLMAKKEPVELNGQEEDLDFFIKNGMERFKDLEAQGEVKVINAEATFN